ncbi:hypothetical protein C1645_839881 [Glomus cerebriforme]|uniref:Uncharacterized protein n=1 Tax=Glomus cerebriforme TaxID=658196 RepID=A0A397S752_9GLOM|nr:hypothetical protein C1645_839881 [Glomus cerebriforme]
MDNFVNEEDIIYEEDFNKEPSNIISESEEETEIYLMKQLSIKTVIHSLIPIEYPPTSEEGVAIIYHVEGWENKEAAFANIQYPLGKPSGQNNVNCPYLGDIDEVTHDSVDPDSDLYLKINENLSTNNVESETFAVYLAAYKTKCRYMQNGLQCTGKPILKCFRRHNETISPSYFIGCSEWKINEKFHQFISVKENIDLNLLRQLLDGLYEGESNEPVNNCSTVLHNTYPHRAGNIVKQGTIIQKKCIHSHPTPPPCHVPTNICTRLQKLIHQANDNTMDVTPTSIVTGNLIKPYFGTEYLADVHASLNNANRLRYYVDKIQKEIHPQGHGILGVVYNYSQNINNFCEYVKRLEFFEDNHYMIICTTSEQLSEWIKCTHFQIDLLFKRVSVLTFARVFTNCATTVAYKRIFHALFDLIFQLTGLSPQFKHIHGTGWSCIIADLDYTQAKGLGLVLSEIDETKDWKEHLVHIFKKIREKHYDENVKNDMYSLLTAKSEDAINNLFSKLQMIESVADWVVFYQQKWVIASLNGCMSKIDNETWMTSPNNTNVAEAAHALSNRREKSLKLMTAIIQGRKFYKERFTAIYTHKKYNVPSRGRDQALTQTKRFNVTKSVPVKRKQNVQSGNKKKSKKVIVIDSDTEGEMEGGSRENKENTRFDELEYWERDLALKE